MGGSIQITEQLYRSILSYLGGQPHDDVDDLIQELKQQQSMNGAAIREALSRKSKKRPARRSKPEVELEDGEEIIGVQHG